MIFCCDIFPSFKAHPPFIVILPNNWVNGCKNRQKTSTCKRYVIFRFDRNCVFAQKKSTRAAGQMRGRGCTWTSLPKLPCFSTLSPQNVQGLRKRVRAAAAPRPLVAGRPEMRILLFKCELVVFGKTSGLDKTNRAFLSLGFCKEFK